MPVILQLTVKAVGQHSTLATASLASAPVTPKRPFSWTFELTATRETIRLTLSCSDMQGANTNRGACSRDRIQATTCAVTSLTQLYTEKLIAQTCWILPSHAACFAGGALLSSSGLPSKR